MLGRKPSASRGPRTARHAQRPVSTRIGAMFGAGKVYSHTSSTIGEHDFLLSKGVPVNNIRMFLNIMFIQVVIIVHARQGHSNPTRNAMLASRPSSRGARLHTYEHEERVYTSTPTKIGGHCLDHVRSGLALTWRPERSKIETSADRNNKANNDDYVGRRTISSTFGSKGRFGGLCGLVLKLSHPTSLLVEDFSLRIRRQKTNFMTRYSTPLDLPLGTPLQIANNSSASAAAPADADAADADASAWQQQAFGPQWPAEGILAVAPRSDGDSTPWGDRTNEHFRNVTSSATGHTGALMAIMLSKLANSTNRPINSSADDSVDAASGAEISALANPSHHVFTGGVGTTAGSGGAAAAAEPSIVSLSPSSSLLTAGTSAPAAAAAASARTELHRSVDTIAVCLASPCGTATEGTGTSRSRSDSWAWRARLEQAPAYSKLHRYSFVRELGRGSQGTVLLVRKKIASAASRSRARSGDGSHDTTIAAVGNGVGTDGSLRVLKESQNLPEAVNEARLLLLAGGSGGGSGGGGNGSSGETNVVGGHGVGRAGGAAFRASLDRAAAAAVGVVNVGPTRRVVAPAEGIGEGKERAAAGCGGVHESGQVVQVMRNGIGGTHSGLGYPPRTGTRQFLEAGP